MTNVIIDNVVPRSQFTATSGQTVFDTLWTVDATSDVVVYARATGVAADDATQLVSSNDYTVSLIGDEKTVRVTFLSGRVEDDIITIIRATPADRENIYTNTNFTPSMLNSDFARTVFWSQQNELDRDSQNGVGIRYNYSEVLTLPRDQILPALGAKQTWRMNAAHTAIEAIDFDDGGGAPVDAYYYVGQSDLGLTNEINLGALTSGLLKHTVAAGLSTPATAVNGTDYWAPGDDLTRASVPTSGSDVTNKTYVDAIAGGFTFINPARVATTGNFASTYDNGASGVGATLTASSNGAAFIDGVSLALNDRVLFKDQTTTYQNGIYFVSQVGDGSTPAIYTRATDFDQPDEISPGEMVNITEGTDNAETFWFVTANPATIGVDAITFALFGINPNNVVTIDGTQTITGAKTFNANVAIGNSATLNLNSSTAIDGVIDDDTMATASATTAATSESVKAYVDAQAGGGLQSVQVFTTNGTWTKPAGITKVIAEVQAGGGGGGGCGNASGNGFSGGGGGGGYARKFIDVTATASETVTVGAGGAGGNTSGSNGAAGGTSSFGAFVSATGGGGGTGTPGNTNTSGGAGGSGAGGDSNVTGGEQLVKGGAGGRGGSSFLAPMTTDTANFGDTPVPGEAYGGGGAGCCETSTNTKAGATGAGGIVIVWEYA